MLSLFPVQKKAVDHLLHSIRTHGACLNSSDTGTGKTLMSIEMCRELNLRPLVVCPKPVVPAWIKAFQRQGVPYAGVEGWEKLRTGSTPYGTWGFSKRAKVFQYAPGTEAVIFDECHRAKGDATQNSIMMSHAKSIPSICCSATAAEDPSEMKALGYLLGLHKHWDFSIWARQNGCMFNEYNKLTFDPTFRDHYLPLLKSQIYPERGYRVTRADMAEHFSETSIVTEPLDFGDKGAIAKLYEEMAVELEALRERQSYDATGADGLTAQLRARQKVELLKVPLFIQFAQEHMEEGFSVVVFLNFRDSIAKFAGSFPFKVPIIQGGQSAKERQQIIEDFADDKYRLIVANLEAGGLGVNLHDLKGDFPRCSLISPNWNAKTLLQVLGRVDRAGAKTNTLQRIFFAQDSVEDEVRLSLEQKLRNLQTLHNMTDETTTIETSSNPSGTSVFAIDFKGAWKAAKEAMIKEGLYQILDWEAVRLDNLITIIVQGTEANLTKGEKIRLTRALRREGHCSNIGWKLEAITPSFPSVIADEVANLTGFPQPIPTTINVMQDGKWVSLKELQAPVEVNAGGEPEALPAVDVVAEVSVSQDYQPNVDGSLPSVPVEVYWGGNYEKPEGSPLWRPPVEETSLVGGAPTDSSAPPAEAHARFNPSSWGYFERCPSYKNRENQEDTTAADAGTRVHAIIETGDMSLGQDDEERYHAAQIMTWREEALASHGLTPEAREDFSEIRLSIQLASHETFGTCDHLSLAKYPFEDGTKLAVAMDWKYGLTPVDDAEINAQVAAYAIGVFQKFPEVSYLIFYVVLPRQNIISDATFTRAESLPALLLRGETIFRRHRELADVEFNPAPSLCEWCGNMVRCKKLADTTLLLAKRYSGDGWFSDFPEEIHGSQIDDPATIAKLRTITPIVRDWCDGIDKQASHLAFDLEMELPGLKKYYRNTNRSISNPMSAYYMLVDPKAVGLEMEPVMTSDEFFQCISKVGIGELMDAVAKRTPEGVTKKEFQEHIESTLRGYGAMSGGDSQIGCLSVDRKAHK